MCHKWHAACPGTFILNGTMYHILYAWSSCCNWLWWGPGTYYLHAFCQVMHHHEYAFCLAVSCCLPVLHPFLILWSCKEDCARIAPTLVGWEINSQCSTETFHYKILASFKGRYFCANSCILFGKVTETRCQGSVLSIYRYLFSENAARKYNPPSPLLAVCRISYLLVKIWFPDCCSIIVDFWRQIFKGL